MNESLEVRIAKNAELWQSLFDLIGWEHAENFSPNYDDQIYAAKRVEREFANQSVFTLQEVKSAYWTKFQEWK